MRPRVKINLASGVATEIKKRIYPQNAEFEWINEGKINRNHSTQDSRVVPHRGTNWAAPWLTSQIGRDAVFSGSYGRGYLHCFSMPHKHFFPRTTVSTITRLDVQHHLATSSKYSKFQDMFYPCTLRKLSSKSPPRLESPDILVIHDFSRSVLKWCANEGIGRGA